MCFGVLGFGDDAAVPANCIVGSNYSGSEIYSSAVRECSLAREVCRCGEVLIVMVLCVRQITPDGCNSGLRNGVG